MTHKIRIEDVQQALAEAKVLIASSISEKEQKALYYLPATKMYIVDIDRKEVLHTMWKEKAVEGYNKELVYVESPNV